jgi:hypothetical protein
MSPLIPEKQSKYAIFTQTPHPLHLPLHRAILYPESSQVGASPTMATVEQWKPTTDPAGALDAALAAVTRRLRLARWVHHVSRGLLAALAICLIAVILDHFDWLPDALPLVLILPATLLIGLLIGTITAFGRPISRMTVARLAETRLGLKERLSSALEFERTGSLPGSPEAFVQLQQRDAYEFAQRLKATEAAPIPIHWETKALIPAFLIVILALILPNLPVFLPHKLVVERSIVKKEGQELARTAQVIQKQAETQNLPATRHAALTMQRLAQRMAQGRMNKQQAMVRMSTLTKQIQAQQRQIAQQAGQTAQNGGKSLAQAGQELAAALQGQKSNGGQSSQGASKGQKGAASGSKSHSAKGGTAGASGANTKNTPQGFNVPSKLQKPQGQNPQNAPSSSSQQTPEVQRAAQAMQNNDAQTLSQQLRQLAQKTQAGQLTPAQQRQAAQDLQKLAQALQGTGMPQTQQHTQAAAQAMAHGDTKGAAQELQRAADAAEREAQAQQDAQGMQSAQDSLQNGEDQMAGAQDPGDINGPPGQACPPGQVCQPCQPGQPCASSNQPGSGPPISANGPPSNGGYGAGRGKPQTTYHKGQRPNRRVVEKPGGGKDAPHWLDPHLASSQNPNYRKLYFGKPQTAGPSQSGTTRKAHPGSDNGPVTSRVPYYNTVITARKSAESAMDREDIPPAYKTDVSRYFNSLQPTTNSPAH